MKIGEIYEVTCRDSRGIIVYRSKGEGYLLTPEWALVSYPGFLVFTTKGERYVLWPNHRIYLSPNYHTLKKIATIADQYVDAIKKLIEGIYPSIRGPVAYSGPRYIHKKQVFELAQSLNGHLFYEE
jgi:type IV secretory pathway protease TraF